MLRRFVLSTGAAILAIAFQISLPGSAWAHFTQIEASASCEDGILLIQYTTTSWSPAAVAGENPQIDILFNNVVVDSGDYSFATGNSFSGSALAPLGSGPGDSVTVTALAVATWGDGVAGGQSASTSVTLPAECGQTGLGRFTGGGHQIRIDGVRVTRGLTIHCDLLLSNNLEVNWGGNRFHMTEHLTTVACTDDPNIIQAPPAAPLDTLIGVGTGRYNGVNGFTINFTLVDAGEPGAKNDAKDQMRILIFETADPGNVVLDVPLQDLSGGNLQAHFDQPHKPKPSPSPSPAPRPAQ